MPCYFYVVQEREDGDGSNNKNTSDPEVDSVHIPAPPLSCCECSCHVQDEDETSTSVSVADKHDEDDIFVMDANEDNDEDEHASITSSTCSDDSDTSIYVEEVLIPNQDFENAMAAAAAEATEEAEKREIERRNVESLRFMQVVSKLDQLEDQLIKTQCKHRQHMETQQKHYEILVVISFCILFLLGKALNADPRFYQYLLIAFFTSLSEYFTELLTLFSRAVTVRRLLFENDDF